jgi:DNA repair exonuclease SbcCD ATPase subunit/DNA repair exonuclease SbcCD nuclease subunit
MKKRYICLSDPELTRDRLDIAGKIFADLLPKIKGADRVFFLGDLYREFNASTVLFATSWFREFADATKEPPLFVVGNHDIEIGCDRISASLRSIGTVASSPVVESGGPIPIAILPSPNRASFGASRGPEGKRARDAELSNAIEAALISLETQIGPDNLGKSILLFHGAIAGVNLGKNVLSPGLTWEIPAARLSRFGLAIGGHIHQPQKIGDQTYYVGGLANWQFTDRAERFRAMVIDIDGDGFHVSDIPLLRPLVPIEFEIDENWMHGGPLDSNFTDKVFLTVLGIGAEKTDTVALRIRARLPKHLMARIPKDDELREAINELAGRTLIQSLTIAREVIGQHKARIETTTQASQMTLEEMLDLYVATVAAESSTENVVAIPDDAALDLARGLLRKIADSYKPGVSTLGWKPLTLEVSNFRQWASARIDFSGLGGAIVLCGPNESGKTNLLEALLFCLYKRSPSSASTIDEELRKGEQTGSVVLMLEAGAETYRLSRALERGRGGVTCKSELARWTGDEPTMWEPVCETASEVDKRVAELVGGYDFLRWLTFRSQRDLDRLVEATPADWHRIALQTFNLGTFEPVRRAAANEAENSRLRAEQVTTRLDELDKQRGVDATELGMLAGSDELRTSIEGYDTQIGEYREKKAALEKEREALLDKRAAVREQINGRRDLEERIQAAKAAISRLVPDSIGDRPPVPAIDAVGIEAKAAEVKARRDELIDQDAAKSAAYGKVCGRIMALEEQGGSIEREIEGMESNLKAHEESQGKLEQPPCIDLERNSRLEYGGGADEKWPNGNGWPTTSCPAWLYYSKADRGAELAEKLRAAREHKMLQGAELTLANQQAAEIAEDRKALQAALSEVTPALQRLEKQLGDYRNALHAAEMWDEKSKAEAQRREQKGAREAELLDLGRKLEGKAALDTGLSDVLQEIERTENKIDAQDKLIEAAQAGRREKQQELDKIELYTRRIAEANEKAREYEAEHKKHSDEATAWGLLAEAFHATGIPYLLMERNIGRVETVANELLAASGSDLRIGIETVTPTKKGEARDKLSVNFTDARGEHPLCKASGEQSIVLSMALSAALSIAGSEYWGAPAELFVQDEGFDRIDLEHREIIRGLIGEIGRRFGRFLFISHLEWIQDSADAELRVVAENGVSRLEAG